jgi:hypothetical protein
MRVIMGTGGAGRPGRAWRGGYRVHEPGRARQSCPPRSGAVNTLHALHALHAPRRLSVLSLTIPYVLLRVSGYEHV